MIITVSPSVLSGTIVAQPSKSDAHRKIICAAFANGVSVLDNLVLSEDIKATLRCISAAGCEYKISKSKEFSGRNTISITGTNGKVLSNRKADCGESGSTLRFMSMVFAAAGGITEFTGRGRLPERSMEDAIEFLKKNHFKCRYPKDGKFLPLVIEGELNTNEYRIDSSVTSQYISGLLMALPAFSKTGSVTAVGNYESRGYVDVTIRTLKEFGVMVTGENPYIINENNGFYSCLTNIEGDWSNSSYFLIMKAMGASIEVNGLDSESAQPDSIIKDHINTIINLESPEINVSECPDIMPSLAVLGAALNKNLKITGGRRLRAKESDRINSVAKGLSAIGVKVKENTDGIDLFNGGSIKGGFVNAFNDHRIAMAFSTLCAISENDIVIEGAESVTKSYPRFFEDLKKLGGIIK